MITVAGRIVCRCLSLSVALLGTWGISSAASASGLICTSADTLQFGNRAVGTVTTANATVTNCGDVPFTFTNVNVHAATGPAFQVSTTCATGLTLAPGAACALGVTFAPTLAGQTSGALWLHNTTSNPDQLITFYGRGVDAQNGAATLAFVPSSVGFAPQAVDTQSPPLVVELRNLGPSPLTLSALVINGPDAYDFDSVSDQCQVGAVIAAGASCRMSLFFVPQAAGLRRANLVIDSPQLAALAILQVSGIGIAKAPATVDVIEFYHAGMDHYFVSSLAADIGALDSGHFPGWTRTGHAFKAYPGSAAGTSAVCRFYIPPQHGDSHFLSADPDECAAVRGKTATDPNYSGYVDESSAVFYIGTPDRASGVCAAGTRPVYRLWNGRDDSNHRYTADPQINALMLARGYIAEGYGPDATSMCAPQ